MATTDNNDDFITDDFEKLLNDFVNNNEDVDGNQWDKDERKESKSLDNEWNIPSNPSVVSVDLAYIPEEDVPDSFSARTMFRFMEGYKLSASVKVRSVYDGYSYFRMNGIAFLKTEFGDVLQKKDWCADLNQTEALPSFAVHFDYLSPLTGEPCFRRSGKYQVDICDMQENLLFQRPFQLLDLPESYPACFSFMTFGLYRVNKGEYFDFQEQHKSQNTFNIKNLTSVMMVFVVENLLKECDVAEFELKLYNETGQLLKSERMIPSLYELEQKQVWQLTWSLGDEDKPFWNKQVYLVEVSFMDETVILAPFEIGTKDTEAIYGLDTIQPKANIAGKKIVKATSMINPMDQLEQMIGLQRVKQQVDNFRNMVELARKRTACGLVTSLPLLHSAFIGNPGTGKTTVAKLFGAILKELGLLSKGHVVFEERSTLTGQFYSSEHEKTLKALERAKGGILFIDEAYTLYKPNDPKDPGMQVLETLLTALADSEQRDWMLLLAGYPDLMNEMLAQNPGFDSRIPLQNRYYFDDYNVDELMQIAELYCAEHAYVLTPEARKALFLKVKRDYSVKDSSFGNGRYIKHLLSFDVLQAMSARVSKIKEPSLAQLSTIEVEDIPQVKARDYKQSLARLQKMVGLSELKKSIESHLNVVKFVTLRAEMGIHTEMPPLHMLFTGNPGTGKTTVADLIGEIYASLGLLSVGNVIRVERSDLVGTYIGDTEKKTKAVLQRARGNVLFIDEAYTLYSSNEKDFGKRVLETLLSELSREETDMIVILAGYPEEMNTLLETNPGLKSRFPYTFCFQDYSVDELLEIAKGVARRSHYHFSPAALRSLKRLIEQEVARKDSHFGNARFVTRLILAHILPAMSNRLAKLNPSRLKNKNVLQTIYQEDIPVWTSPDESKSGQAFDEKAIARSLRKLDRMIGLEHVKQGIHNFVEIARYLNMQGKSYGEMHPLRWNFTGNTGTGKSTVAGILGELLKAMNLLGKGHLVEVKGESLYNVSEYKVDEILRNAMCRSQQGLLFVDGDAPQFKNPGNYFDGEKLRIKLGTLTAELPGSYALVIAGNEMGRHSLAHRLRQSGITEFDQTFYFADYSEDELFRILECCLRKWHLKMDEKATGILRKYITGLCSRRDLGYANARTMKNLSVSISDRYLLRASKGEVPVQGLIEADDVAGFVWNEVRDTSRVGYL